MAREHESCWACSAPPALFPMVNDAVSCLCILLDRMHPAPWSHGDEFGISILATAQGSRTGKHDTVLAIASDPACHCRCGFGRACLRSWVSARQSGTLRAMFTVAVVDAAHPSHSRLCIPRWYIACCSSLPIPRLSRRCASMQDYQATWRGMSTRVVSSSQRR